MDATNAFNSINRISLIWNIRVLWPRASRFIFNTYRGWSPLIVRGSTITIFSREGVVQGDPLSMFAYSVATMPLIQELNCPSLWRQIWFADDSSVIGDVSVLRSWLDKLLSIGPKFGYFPEPSKSYLIVKEPSLSSVAHHFSSSGIHIVSSGRYLGGVIGDVTGIESFVESKVNDWSRYVELLSSLATDQPQAAYIGLTRSLQSEWLFLQRVTPNCGNLFNTIENVLSTLFIPSLLGHNCSPHERLLFSLPVRMGGLNIQNPMTTADFVYSASRSAVQFLVDSIQNQTPFCSADHYMCVYQSRQQQIALQKERNDTTFSSLLHNFDGSHQRAILRSKDTLSSWLNTLPLQNDNFNLSAQEFRDAICLRYMKPLLNLPPTCDGCGAAFTTIHALDCRKGGLVSLRHNEIRDLLCELSSIVWNNVVREPVIQESSTSLSEGLIADLAVRGVWQRQCTAMFDVRILDSDSPSYSNKSPQSVVAAAEIEKKRKYSAACESHHCSFTPLCFTIDGLMGKESKSFLKCLAEGLSTRWNIHYSVSMNWVRTKLSFALLRPTNLCLRGTRSIRRGVNIEDGFGVNPTIM